LSAKSPKRSATKIASADRYIPNRSFVDFDFCNHILNQNENEDSSSSGDGGQVDTKVERLISEISGPLNKRLIGCFDNSNSDHPTSPVRDRHFSDSFQEAKDNSHEKVSSPKKTITRSVPNGPSKILDAPDLVNDYYLNLLHWGKNNIMSVALKNSVYLWNADDSSITNLLTLENDDIVTSVQFSPTDNTIAVGTQSNTVQIWDSAKCVKLRDLRGHSARIGSLSWNNGNFLSSGSKDSLILNHDIRQHRNIVSRFVGHNQEVCGLTWSHDGTTLASGGNENMLCLWDLNMSNRESDSNAGLQSSQYYEPRSIIHDHQAAVKALAWCPWQRNVLASGGGSADRTIRIWNTATSNPPSTKVIDTGSQVCAIQWNEHYKELVSSHGYSDNQLILWKYPTMTKIREFRGHTQRVLHMVKSPDGCTICTASADETIRFWDIFSCNGKPPSSINSSKSAGQLRVLGNSSPYGRGMSIR
jgi:cell division cycle protein 20 (cofactor of APC complex)